MHTPTTFPDSSIASYAPSLMAFSGHSSIQVPQSTQVSASTTAFSFSTLMASTGHPSSHVPHPVHFSRSTITAIFHLLIEFIILKEILSPKDSLVIFVIHLIISLLPAQRQLR